MPKVGYGTLVKIILSLKMPAVVLDGVLSYSNKLVNDRMKTFFQRTLTAFCLARSRPKLFAKIISRQQSAPMAYKELIN